MFLVTWVEWTQWNSFIQSRHQWLLISHQKGNRNFNTSKPYLQTFAWFGAQLVSGEGHNEPFNGGMTAGVYLDWLGLLQPWVFLGRPATFGVPWFRSLALSLFRFYNLLEWSNKGSKFINWLVLLTSVNMTTGLVKYGGLIWTKVYSHIDILNI